MMRLAIVLSAMIVAAGPVDAATLSVVVNGDILVNSGNGFTRAKVVQELRAGDRVMVGAGGGDATISYDGACVQNVQIGKVATVKAASPCNSAHNGDPGTGGVHDSTLVPGAVAVAVGAGVIIYHVTKPSSP